MKKQVLGIKIDDVGLDQAVNIVAGWLHEDGKHYIVTPNPEMVVMAQKDEELKKIINQADLAIPDGVGLKLAGINNRVTGIELMERLVERGFTTGFLGGKDEVAAKTAECLKKKYPGLKVNFAESGGEVDKTGNVVGRLPRSAFGGPRNDKSVDILFVAFGPPKQEKWIAKNLAKLNIKVAMGVGGAFDILSGWLPRAPQLVRDLGWEWLFRLMVQPWRIKRQMALIKYLWLLLLSSPLRRNDRMW